MRRELNLQTRRITVSFAIEPAWRERLDQVAQAHETTASQLLRELVMESLPRFEASALMPTTCAEARSA